MGPRKELWWQDLDENFDFENEVEFKNAKDIFKDLDPANEFEMPNELFFENLHKKIMCEVSKTEVKKDFHYYWHRHSKKIKKFSAAVLAVTTVLIGREIQTVKYIQNPEMIVLKDALKHSPRIDGTVLVYQHQDDFFVDLVQENFDHLNVEQMQGLIGANINN